MTILEWRAEDEFMLLALDSLWDAMSGEALAGLVASCLCLGLAPELLCAQLLDTCLCKVLTMGLGITKEMNLTDLEHRDFSGRLQWTWRSRWGSTKGRGLMEWGGAKI